MKNKMFRLIGAGALAAGLMVAQTATPPAAAGGQGFGARMMNRATRALNLTSDQQAQLQQIMAGFRQTSQPVRQQLRTDRQALMTAAKANPGADLTAQASAVAKDLTQLAVVRAQAFGQFYNTLTPAQKQQVDSFHGHRGRFGRG